jgi:hypothetical protein
VCFPFLSFASLSYLHVVFRTLPIGTPLPVVVVVIREACSSVFGMPLTSCKWAATPAYGLPQRQPEGLQQYIFLTAAAEDVPHPVVLPRLRIGT